MEEQRAYKFGDKLWCEDCYSLFCKKQETSPSLRLRMEIYFKGLLFRKDREKVIQQDQRRIDRRHPGVHGVESFDCACPNHKGWRHLGKK